MAAYFIKPCKLTKPYGESSKKMEAIISCTIITEVISFIVAIFLLEASYSRVGVIPGHEYQEAGIIGSHLRSLLDGLNK